MEEKKQWGGYRPNAGRKNTGKKRYQLYLTESELTQVKQLIERLREESKSPDQ